MEKNYYIFIILPLVFFIGKRLKHSNLNKNMNGEGNYLKNTIGARNHNPFNVRKSNEKFLGQTGDNGGFKVFSSDYYGVRCAVKVIKTYRTKYGLNTIEKIISRFAPSNENNTSGYINHVSDSAGIAKNKELTTPAQYLRVLSAMAYIESNFKNDRLISEVINDVNLI